MSDSNLKHERREREERRRADGYPPSGVSERRVNIERRLFNLGIDCGEAWLSKPAPDGGWNATPLSADLNASGELPAG
jgi:hypothetical protein